MKPLAILFGLTIANGCVAAPGDWKAYLCRYGSSDAAGERAQLVRVNEKDQRVVVNERDKAAKFSATGVSFEGPPEVFWVIGKDGKLTVLGPYGPLPGVCRIVDD